LFIFSSLFLVNLVAEGASYRKFVRREPTLTGPAWRARVNISLEPLFQHELLDTTMNLLPLLSLAQLALANRKA